MSLKGFDSIESINEAFYNKNFKVFNYIGPDIYGDNYNEGVLWIRPRSLLLNMVEGFNQIVGHTEVGFDKLEQRIFSLGLLAKNDPSIHDYFDKDKMDLQVVLIDSKQRNIFCITDTEQKTVELFEEI